MHHSDCSSESKAYKKTRRGGKRAKAQRERKLVRQGLGSSPSEPEQKSNEPVKYKTELCKNWLENGKCKYSVRCKFAHGKHELVSNDSSARQVRKANCESYHNDKYCPYGIRCQYTHDVRT